MSFEIKSNNTVKDISKWNTISSYKELANNSDGIIIRLAYRGNSTGNITADPKAKTHLKELLENECKIGIYFFTNAINEREAEEEAEYCLNYIKENNIELSFPIIIDTEYGNNNHTGRADNLSKNVRTNCVKAFINKCNENGYYAAIYASDSWFINNLNYNEIKDIPKWVAKYNPNKKIKFAKDNVLGLQYTSKGNCPGVIGNIDESDWYVNIGEGIKIEENKSPIKVRPFKDGEKIKIDNVNLYSSSTTEKVSGIKSGTFYIWNKTKRNGRVRITTKPEYVKELGKVTGWVNCTDII